MAYHGTEIDGVSIAPDGLEVRGVNLLEIIARYRYPQAIAHMLSGCGAEADQSGHIEAGLNAILAGMTETHPGLALTAQAARAGANGVQAVSAGILVPLRVSVPEDVRTALVLDDETAAGLAVVAALPVFLRVAIDPDTAARALATARSTAPATYVEKLHALFVASPEPVATAALERALVGWHGGFGYLPPSVMIPRLSIGTGVPIRQAIAAGFAAGGPMHIGATEHALRLIARILEITGADGDADAVAGRLVGAILAEHGRLPGFGHPLFDRDPRPSALIEACAPLLAGTPEQRAYDALVVAAARETGLPPNIDAAMATVFLAAGISDPQAAAALSLCARAVAMVGHCRERRLKPAFGVTSRVARQHLDSLPKDWL